MTKLNIGLTVGDPAGIGPEIALKAIAGLKGAANFLLIGGQQKKRNFRLGRPQAESGRLSIEYLEQALRLWQEKKIDCLVTCPISKEAIHKAHFPYSGHTEYFAARLKIKNPVMMLLNGNLRFSLVTRHIPLKEVSARITPGNLEKNISLTLQGLKKYFAIAKPKIVVCALNPHASDNGTIGSEEKNIIIPAIKRIKHKLSACIEGPLPADIAIRRLKDEDYHCAIAMYHDQALIPLKQLTLGSGVNLTLGLPFIRTSPLHGTAFDIAGRNQASPDSLISAIKLAVECTLKQKRN